MVRRQDVLALVDWRSQISNANQTSEPRAERKAERTLVYVTRKLSESLEATGQADLYNVSVRLYHGWFKGLTFSENRKALGRLFLNGDAPSLVSRTRFTWERPFGDLLLCANDFRLHPRLKIHLPDTLRDALDGSGRQREKMVDTALAVDLLHSARSEPADWRVVMAEDDDVIPAIFASEHWGKSHGGKTIILRTSLRTSHLNLSGLIWQIAI